MQTHQGPSRYNVVGEYPDMAGARRAIDALQFHGVEADHISLEGEQAEAAARSTPTETTEREQPIFWRALNRALVWGAAGAVVGAVLGSILGALGIEYGRLSNSMSIEILSWALYGVIAGSLIGMFSAVTINEDWQLTFGAAGEGPVSVGVHSDEPRDVERAEHILRDKQALRVSRFDEHGHPATRSG